MNKIEILRRIGSVEQIGGIRDFIFNDGKASGVRGIEIDTGSLRFTILPDRGMDIAQASFKGCPVSWISNTGITDSRFYEKDDKNFLRGFFGGLVTTCGLKNIGGPVGEYGLHDRISNTPAEKVSIFADWIGDEYVMEVSGQVRQCSALCENLLLKRTIKTKLFSNEFVLEDTVVNESFETETIALAYHCNFGYPLVSEESKIINVPEEVAGITEPLHGIEEECIEADMIGDTATVGIKNKDIGAYITYKTNTLPKFLVWKMLREGEYVVGLEPRTTNYGGENIEKNNEYVTLKPFQEYKTYLNFEFGEDQ